MEHLKKLHKICVLGDSILRGVVFDQKSNKYTFCNDGAVNNFDKSHDVEIINHSKFGCTVPHALKRFRTAISKGEKMEGVLIELGGNDCDYNWDEVAESPSARHDMNTPLDKFITGYCELIETALSAGVRPFVMNLPPIDYERYFNWITKGIPERADKIMSFLKDKSIIYRNQEYFSHLVEKIARKYDLYVIDVRGALLRLFNYRDYMCIDGIHPNEKGQKLIGEIFANCYKEVYGTN